MQVASLLLHRSVALGQALLQLPQPALLLLHQRLRLLEPPPPLAPLVPSGPRGRPLQHPPQTVCGAALSL